LRILKSVVDAGCVLFFVKKFSFKPSFKFLSRLGLLGVKTHQV